MHCSQLQKGRVLAGVCSSAPWPGLATGKAKGTDILSTQSHTARSFPAALLGRRREVRVTDPAGSCWEKVIDFLWSTEWCADQWECLFCWLRACWAEQESWLLSSSCREANSIAGESWEQQELEEGWNWKQTPAFCQLGTCCCQNLWNKCEVRASTTTVSAAVLQVTIEHNVQDQSPIPETILIILFVLFHSDEGKMVFLKLKLKEEEAARRWSCGALRAWVARTTTAHTLCSTQQTSSLWINTSSSLARSTFCFPLVKCKIYLKINVVPSSLLHSASAALGLSHQQSVLPRKCWKAVF